MQFQGERSAYIGAVDPKKYNIEKLVFSAVLTLLVASSRLASLAVSEVTLTEPELPPRNIPVLFPVRRKLRAI